jgi:NADH-quinone oxidoreductase subunit N
LTVTPLSNPSFVDHLTASVRFVLPEVTLVGAACLLFTLAAFRCSRILSLSLGLIAVAGATAVALLVPEPTDTFNPAYAPIDPSGAAPFIRWIAFLSATVYLLLGWAETHSDSPEYNACLLVVAAGVSLVGRANDLVSVFLALEMISIPTYVLLYLPSRTKAGQEAAMKYFMLSVLSSGMLLFGFSYLYGLTGTTNLHLVISTLGNAAQLAPVTPLALVGMILVIAGIGFRIAAVPFHFYAPDVYEGGPAGVVAQLAFLPKVAGFVVLARLLGVMSAHGTNLPFDTEQTLIPLTLWVIAVVTMSFGNLLALIQDNIRRLFAYSGIAHGGYMLIGVLVACSGKPNGDQSGTDSVLFYLSVYGMMTVGAFAVIAHLTTRERPIQSVDDLAGLGKTNPFAALLLTIFFLSLIGLPLTAGFIGKFNLFLGAFQVPADTKMKNLYQVLVAIAVLNAAVSAVYYLRVISLLFLRSPLKPIEANQRLLHPLPLLAATVCAAAVLAFGIYPQPLADWTRQAAPTKTKLPTDRAIAAIR